MPATAGPEPVGHGVEGADPRDEIAQVRVGTSNFTEYHSGAHLRWISVLDESGEQSLGFGEALSDSDVEFFVDP